MDPPPAHARWRTPFRQQQVVQVLHNLLFCRFVPPTCKRAGRHTARHFAATSHDEYHSDGESRTSHGVVPPTHSHPPTLVLPREAGEEEGQGEAEEQVTAVPKFFSPGDNVHPAYASIRDRAWLTDDRELLEEMWTNYAPVCGDRDFLNMARKDFPAATWQMYLAALLLRADFDVVKTKSAGPDIHVRLNGQSVWIEATAVTSGTGPDRVPSRDERGTCKGNMWTGGMPSDASLILRCTSALREKLKQHRAHRASGIVKPCDAVLLAMNLGAIPDADIAEPLMPFAFKALLPIGDFGWEVELDSQTPPKPGFTNRTAVQKLNGTEIPTDFFLNTESSVFSGFLTSELMVFQHHQTGRDIALLHHPTPDVPLPEANWPWGTEWRSDDGKLQQVGGERYFQD